MKYLRIISVYLLILLTAGCGLNNKIVIEDINPEERVDPSINILADEHFSFEKSFSISFWLKPLSNYYGSVILALEDDNEKITLINNSEDENYNSTGIALVHNNGSLYGGNDFNLETYNYNHIIVGYEDNTFFLYLNGAFIGEKAFSDNFDINDFRLYIDNSSFIVIYKNLIVNDYNLKQEDVIKLYGSDLSLRLENIDFSEEFKNNAKGRVALPISETDISYSSDCDLMKVNDNYLVFYENNTSEDTVAVLKAEYKEFGITVEKEIEFIIKGKNDINSLNYALKVVDNKLNYFISESSYFPDEINGCTIEYSVSSNANYDNNHFVKVTDNVKEIINVKATVSIGDINGTIEKNIVLLDEYKGYLLVYFDGHDGWPEHITGEENIYFAISDNLTNWIKLNKAGLLDSDEGSNRYRDPYISRDKDGNFIITCTEGYVNPGMYVARSEDLINFKTNLVSFNSVDKSLGLIGDKTWAPEFVYDYSNDRYTILFSNPGTVNKSIYGVDTYDFNEYSYPYIYFNAGYNVIDADIEMIDNQYYLFYKNEDNGEIHYAIADSLNKPTWRIEDSSIINDGYPAEGPFIFYDDINNNSYLYIDSYKENQIHSGFVYKWTETLDAYPDFDEGINEIGGVRHFSIIEITEDEYNRIYNYYR